MKLPRTGRGSPLWIVGRIGILICFGIIPLATLPARIKADKAQERLMYHINQFDIANRNFYLCLASNDFAGCTNWQVVMDNELKAATTNEP